MKKMIFTAVVMMGSVAMAHGSHDHEEELGEAFYYVGEQSINLLDKAECFVEVKYSEDQQEAEVRAIAAGGQALGPVQVEYGVLTGEVAQKAYVYQDTTGKEAIGSLVLLSETPANPTNLSAALLHIDHYHSMACEQLTLATDDELIEAQEAFENFGQAVEEDHGHGHGHHHH